MKTWVYIVDLPGSELHGEDVRITAHDLEDAESRAADACHAVGYRLHRVGHLVRRELGPRFRMIFERDERWDDLPEYARDAADWLYVQWPAEVAS